VCLAASAYGTTYYVATNGNNNNSGTQQSPFLTIQRGINAATLPGDKVHVAAGTYNERLVFDTYSGTSANPITLEGEAGTILDGSDSDAWLASHSWALEGGGFAGYYVYSVSVSGYTSGTPRAVYADDKLVPLINYDYCQTAPIADPFNPGHYLAGWWYWQEIFKRGVSSVPFYKLYYRGTADGWNGINGLTMYRSDASKMYLKLMPDGNGSVGLNPQTRSIKWSNYGTTIITIDGADYIKISGLELKYGYQAVKIMNSVGSIVEYCKMVPHCQGIRLDVGADAIELRYNELANMPYANTSTEDLANDYWHTIKDGGYEVSTGFIDKWAIQARGSVGNHYIHDNYIHNGWDGVSTGTDEAGPTSVEDTNIEVAHNLITDMVDDSLDPSKNCINSRWHHNLVKNGQQHIRLRSIQQGPFYLYNNIFLSGPSEIQGMMFFGDFGNHPDVYIYNNTVEESADTLKLRSGLYNNAGTEDFGNYHIYNNIFYGNTYCNPGALAPGGPNWDANRNLFLQKTTFNTTYGETYAKSLSGGTNEQNSVWSTLGVGSVFSDFAAEDVSLKTSGNPALGLGANLNSLFGFAPGSYSTDCGALASGVAMPQYYPFTTGSVVSGITPDSGPTAGGTAVTLSGSNLSSTTAVKFGGTSVSPSYVSATEIRCTSPAKSAGTYSVVATVDGADVGGVSFTYVAQPALTTITPNNGPANGGTACTLSGTNLIGCTAVSFGGTPATGSIIVDSATQVRCTSPAKSAGTYTVTAATPGGNSTGTVNFTYTTANPVTTTLVPSKDTYVDSSDPSAAKGTLTQLKIQGKSGETGQRIYLCFDIPSNVRGNVTLAKLRLYRTTTTSYSYALCAYKVESDTWAESITWNSGRPAFTTPALSTISGARSGNTWYEWDVTSYVNTEVAAAAAAISFCVADPNYDNTQEVWSSREATSNKPQLVVTYQ